jgi:hypothetical protein
MGGIKGFLSSSSAYFIYAINQPPQIIPKRFLTTSLFLNKLEYSVAKYTSHHNVSPCLPCRSSCPLYERCSSPRPPAIRVRLLSLSLYLGHNINTLFSYQVGPGALYSRSLGSSRQYYQRDIDLYPRSHENLNARDEFDLHKVTSGIYQRDLDGGIYARTPGTFKVGDDVRIIGGPFTSFSGTVERVDHPHLLLDILIFGRSTPVRVHFDQVEKA